MSRYMPDPPDTCECECCGRTVADPDVMVCDACDDAFCESCGDAQEGMGESGMCEACQAEQLELHEDRAASLALARRAEQREDDYREDNKR